jgi:zinc transporter family protein
MGKSPAGELLDRIRGAALATPGVRGVHDLRAHYVGHRVHVALHIEVDQELPTRRSHDVGGAVRHAVEALPAVDRAFVHVDPVLASTWALATLAECDRAASRIYSALARHGERPALAALWEALSTAALARAEQLAVARRLKGAGWHFADDEVSAAGVAELRARLAALEERAAGEGADPAGAVAIALALEGDPARALGPLAGTPRDPVAAASLGSATLPPPSAGLLAQRLGAARAAAPELAAELAELGRRVAPEASTLDPDPGQGEI